MNNGLLFHQSIFSNHGVAADLPDDLAGAADDLIKKGDDLDLKLQASEALDFYLAAEKLEPKNASLLVRIARQYRHLMVDATTREGEAQARAASGWTMRSGQRRSRRMTPQAQLSPAISYGKMVPLQGIKEQIGGRAPHQGRGRQGD